MIKKWLLVVSCWLLVFGNASAEGLFYKIYKTGQKPNYVLGTLHSDDPAVLKMHDVAVKTMLKSKLALFEIKNEPTNSIKAMKYMYYATESGQTLPKTAGQALFDKYKKLEPAADETLKPWAAAVLLQYPKPMADGIVLDLKLESLASSQKIPTLGIETIDEQMSIFSTMPESDQLIIFKDAVEEYAKNQELQKDMVAFYKAKNLSKLNELGQKSIDISSNKVLAEKMMDKLLYTRNITMARRLDFVFKNGGAFAAIGALHLPGERGVLELLKNKGYMAEVVY
jgi:uncharacterized protein YbaP (TraB family)